MMGVLDSGRSRKAALMRSDSVRIARIYSTSQVMISSMISGQYKQSPPSPVQCIYMCVTLLTKPVPVYTHVLQVITPANAPVPVFRSRFQLYVDDTFPDRVGGGLEIPITDVS